MTATLIPTLTIARRELASMFRLPVGWVVIALFLVLTASVVALSIQPGAPASLRGFFTLSAWLLMPVAPAVSMRLLAEERRTGTDEMLLTSPVSVLGVVVGKFLGAWFFLLCMLVPTLVYPVLLVAISDPRPDLGPMVSGYILLLLQGTLYLAIGTAVSSMTSNQTLAYLATLFPILALLLAGSLASESLPEVLRPIHDALQISRRAGDFARGIIDTGHVVFFLAASAWCLALAHAGLEWRKWR
ncbi:MAG: ABC transporter permease [Planctomycetota bacterium]|nr:ABC transporter permease [Planctomycetota bacterium]